MQNHKRLFRFLLSLCLVCGCLVNFSSGNAYAYTMSYFPGDTTTATYVIDGGLQVEYRVSSEYPYTEYKDLTSIQSSSAYAWFDGFVNDYFSVTITNSNDYPVTNNKGFFELWATVEYDGTLSQGLTVSSTPSIKIGDMNNCFVGIIGSTTDYPSASCMTIKPNDKYLIDGKFVLMPHESYTFSFSATRCNTFNTTGTMTSPIPQYITSINNFLNQAEATVGQFNFAPTIEYTGGGDMSPQLNLDSNNIKVERKGLYLNGKEVGFFGFRYHDTNTFNLNTVNLNNRFLYTGNVSIPAVITLANTSDSDFALDISWFAVEYPKLTLGFYDNLYSTINYELIDVETDGINTDYWQNEVRFYLSPEDLIDGCLIIPAGERYIFEVNFVYKFDFIRDKYNVLNGSDFNYDIGAYTFNSDCSVPSNDALSREEAAINNQTQQQQQQHEEQMQQQQQQHEEQMQQQQEQYEDLTDPAPEAGNDLVGGTEDEVKEKIGLFTFIDDLIQSMLGLFVPTEEDPVITFPGWSIMIQGVSYQIWEDHTFNLASLDDDFSVLMTAVRFATIAVVYAAFLKFLVDTYNRIILGSDGD